MADIGKLAHPFVVQFLAAINSAEKHGLKFRITFTLRTPMEQGALWRKGRGRAEIDKKIADLRRQGCDYLADCINLPGPQQGRKVTNAIPGLSWHQYGEAADVLAYRDGELLEDGEDEAYRVVLREAAKAQGLYTGYSWGDAGHVQASVLPKPRYPIEEIDVLMRERFTNSN